MRYLALLRGINVGGNSIIRMTDLKACFEGLGFSDVATFIASGNVIFSTGAAPARLAEKIEKALTARFKYPARVVIVPLATLRAVVRQAPKGFGTAPARYRYDVIFLKEPLTPKEAMKAMSPKPGVDAVTAGRHAVYFSRLIAKAAQSRLSKIVGTPAYAFMTIRTWNTATKLLALMEG